MAEVVRLLHTVIGKVDGIATSLSHVEADVHVLKTDVQVLKIDVRSLEKKFDRLEGKVDVLNGQFQDVARVVIEDTQRIKVLEGQVDTPESKAN